MDNESILGRVPLVRVARPIRFPVGAGAGQRAARRRELVAQVDVREAESELLPLPLSLDEVSATGAFIMSDLLLPVGTNVELAFELPETASNTAGLVSADGHVVRVEEGARRPGMGIVFDRMPPNARAALRAFTHWH